MKHWVLGTPLEELRRTMKRETLLCAVPPVAAVLAGALLLRFVTRPYYGWFLGLTLILNILAGWFLLGWISLRLWPRRRCCRLMERAERVGEQAEGQLTEMGGLRRVNGLDCHAAVLETGEGPRTIFVVDGTFSGLLNPGVCLRFTLADNIAVACEVLS